MPTPNQLPERLEVGEHDCQVFADGKRVFIASSHALAKAICDRYNAHGDLVKERDELKMKVAELETRLRRANSFLDEALNSGNGTYKP